MGERTLLGECVQSLLDDGAERVVLVDNGVVNMPVLPDDSRLTVVSPGGTLVSLVGVMWGRKRLGMFVMCSSSLTVTLSFRGRCKVLAGYSRRRWCGFGVRFGSAVS